ncbi:MAG: RidA family protein [Xanthobacteraceae bacterium]
MAEIKIYNPDNLYSPKPTYKQIALVKASEFAFIAGQVSVDATGNVTGANDFLAQCRQVYSNIQAALHALECTWRNVVQFTTFVTRAEDLPALSRYRAEEFPRMFPDGAYPPNTLLVIDRLAHPDYLLEVQTIAAR